MGSLARQGPVGEGPGTGPAAAGWEAPSRAAGEGAIEFVALRAGGVGFTGGGSRALRWVRRGGVPEVELRRPPVAQGEEFGGRGLVVERMVEEHLGQSVVLVALLLGDVDDALPRGGVAGDVPLDVRLLCELSQADLPEGRAQAPLGAGLRCGRVACGTLADLGLKGLDRGQRLRGHLGSTVEQCVAVDADRGRRRGLCLWLGANGLEHGGEAVGIRGDVAALGSEPAPLRAAVLRDVLAHGRCGRWVTSGTVGPRAGPRFLRPPEGLVSMGGSGMCAGQVGKGPCLVVLVRGRQRPAVLVRGDISGHRGGVRRVSTVEVVGGDADALEPAADVEEQGPVVGTEPPGALAELALIREAADVLRDDGEALLEEEGEGVVRLLGGRERTAGRLGAR